MRRRRRDEDAALSLDSFLDIVTNVVGVLILVAVVTVLGAGDIGVSAGASALAPPRRTAARVMFELSGDEVFFVDEAAHGERVKAAVTLEHGEKPFGAQAVVNLLEERDIGDALYRVRGEVLPEGLSWIYDLRPGVRGEPGAVIESRSSVFQGKLDELEPGGFVYLVVHDDSFDVLRKARDIARERGIAVGWHPVEGRQSLRLSGAGSLGKRIQ